MADIERSGSVSGLTEDEAKEFHKFFMTGFIVFTLIAIVAHFLVWQWRSESFVKHHGRQRKQPGGGS